MNATCMVFENFSKRSQNSHFYSLLLERHFLANSLCSISVFFSTIVKKLSNTFDHPALFKNSSMVHIEGQKTLNDLVEAAFVF